MDKEQEQLIDSFRIKASNARRHAERLQHDMATQNELAMHYDQTVDKLKEFFEPQHGDAKAYVPEEHLHPVKKY